MKIRILMIASLFLLGSFKANATVSAYAEFYIPYQQIQTDDICLNKQIMEAEFGIPLAAILKGVFAPTQTLHSASSIPDRYANINLLVNGTTKVGMKYNFDRYHDNGIYDYSFTLDIGAFNSLNGNSAAGRQKTINTAKLAVIAVLKTAVETHKAGRFRVWINFINLPSQSGLSGSKVYVSGTDWPSWPYTASSPLYQAYLKEMIHKDCR